jgi:hypothetical protein
VNPNQFLLNDLAQIAPLFQSIFYTTTYSGILALKLPYLAGEKFKMPTKLDHKKTLVEARLRELDSGFSPLCRPIFNVI